MWRHLSDELFQGIRIIRVRSRRVASVIGLEGIAGVEYPESFVAGLFVGVYNADSSVRIGDVYRGTLGHWRNKNRMFSANDQAVDHISNLDWKGKEARFRCSAWESILKRLTCLIF